MVRILYSGLMYLALPFVFLRLLWKAKRLPAYGMRWRERLGLYPDKRRPSEPGQACVIFHAVSVGEVHAAVPLIRKLQAARPDCRVILTTTTPTGSERVGKLFSESVSHQYLPYDIPGAVNRFLRFTRPHLLVMMETELWPNLIHSCKQSGVRMLLANARLSEKSRRGYARIGGLVRTMLACVDTVAAQSEADAQRFQSLGLAAEKLLICGNLKYDQEFSEEQVAAGRKLRAEFGEERPALIAASTREGEDSKVLKAYSLILEHLPETLLILVPRHPQRFDSAHRLCREAGFSVLRRSECGAGPERDIQVLLGDSMGEMALYYGMADIAFVGGSLVDTGSQNMLEPAVLGLPVICGPSRYNFQAVSDKLARAGALKVVEDEQGLAAAVIELFGNPALYRTMSAAAGKVIGVNRGATDRTLERIVALLD